MNREGAKDARKARFELTSNQKKRLKIIDKVSFALFAPSR